MHSADPPRAERLDRTRSVGQRGADRTPVSFMTRSPAGHPSRPTPLRHADHRRRPVRPLLAYTQATRATETTQTPLHHDESDAVDHRRTPGRPYPHG
jgi:hypothetical protein